MEKFLSEKKIIRKNLLGKQFLEKKIYEHDLICIFVYQMGRLCGGAH